MRLRACVCFHFLSEEGGGGEEAKMRRQERQGLALSWVCPVHFTLSDLTPSLLHMLLKTSVLEGVRGGRGGRGLDTRQRFQQTKHHHHHRSEQDLATRLIHSPHHHYPIHPHRALHDEQQHVAHDPERNGHAGQGLAGDGPSLGPGGP